MQVQLTVFANQQLKEIHNYYSATVSVKVASEIINRIFDSIETLERLPTIGTTENSLKKLGYRHRFIVSGNYKIIFCEIEGVIFVTDIFDARQDPSKILKRNK